MSRRIKQIGFSQRIRLEWLEKTANLVLAGNDKDALYQSLRELLWDKLSAGSEPQRGNREKAITILMKIWFGVPLGLEPLRDDGLRLLTRLPRDVHFAIHWGMAMAVYPFWGAVAAQAGRLLRLQGTVAAAQVQRRMREQYGERETVSRAARRVLRSFVDWRVLNETDVKGVYGPAVAKEIADPELLSWLAEASIHSGESASMPFHGLLDAPSLYPFQLAHISAGRLAKSSPRLEIVHHGLSEEILTLRPKRSKTDSARTALG